MNSEKVDGFLKRTISWLFLALFFFLPLLFYRRASEVFELPKMYFIYAITTLLVGLWISRMIIQKKILIKKTPLDIPILLFLISQLVSTFLSIDPHTSWFGYYSRFHGGLWSTISYTLLYYVYVNSNWSTVNSKKQGSAIYGLPFTVYPIVTSAVLVSLYAILEHFGIDKAYWVQDVVNRVFSTQGQPNWLAAYLVMVMPIVLIMIVRTKNSYASIVFLPFTVYCLLFTALLFTKSRSGLIGFAIMDVVFWFLFLWRSSSRARSNTTSREIQQSDSHNKILFLTIHCLQLITLLSFPNPARDLLLHKTTQEITIAPALEGDITLRKSAQGGTESGDIRHVVWSGAFQLVKQHPLFGTGPETFAYTYWWVRPKAHNLTSEWNFLYNKAHNEWLNLAANTGLFGLGSHILLLLWFSIWSIKYILRFTDHDLRFTLIAILAAVLGVEAVNFFGFSTVTVGAYTYLYMALAVTRLQATSHRIKSATPSFQPFNLLTPSSLFTILFIAIFIIFKISLLFIADLSYAQGRSYLADRYAFQALKPLEIATRLVPNEPTFRSLLAEDEGLLAISLQETEQKDLAEKLKQESLQNFDVVEKQGPYNLSFLKTESRVVFSLGVFDASLYDRGITLSKKAQQLAPTNPSIPYTIGVMLDAIEKRDETKQFYQQALELKPDYVEAREKLYL